MKYSFKVFASVLIACFIAVSASGATLLTTWNGYSFYKVNVSGIMSDNNVYNACVDAGMTVPCDDVQNGAYSDSLCLDVGFRDGSNPMSTLSDYLCSSAYPNECPALYGVFQYMGHKWGHEACGAFSGNWCADGNQSSNYYALCVESFTLPQCSIDRCTPEHPCSSGFGDCDTNNDCTDGVCVINVGLDYGCPWWVDVCVLSSEESSSSTLVSSSIPTSSSTTTTLLPIDPQCNIDRCGPEHPCQVGEGDCDTNNDCIDSFCEINAGLDYGCPWWVDICATPSVTL